jgi:hypothetical protein
VNFIHEHRQDFTDLIKIVAADLGLVRSIVEKDYWVTHTLWALCENGFEVWFKGGTSLSKGFELIQRFSEDLDLKIEPGTANSVPSISNWKSQGIKATAARRAYFSALLAAIRVPDCRVTMDEERIDETWRAANIQVMYPSVFPNELPPELAAHVLLEIGSARVTPYVLRDISSWVHEKLAATGVADEFTDNRAQRIRCVHPFVTLLEKLDALHRRFPNDKAEPQTFVRHYEDAARLLAGL